MSASSSVGGIPLVIWAAAGDPADVPMVRSASVISNPASKRPAITPISHALPTDPAPPRTSARSPAARTRVVSSTCGCSSLDLGGSDAVAEANCGIEEGVVFKGAALRELRLGRSRWRLPQSRDHGLQARTHCKYCVHGSHLPPTITTAKTLARRRRE